MRCALYARYSSDLQSESSIDDQMRLARAHAARQDMIVVGEYHDAAISGASTANRPGLLKLIADAAGGKFDVVLTESLDRLARDLGDLAKLHQQLQFHNVRIVTLADGEANRMHVALKGLMAELFLGDLAQKTRRGQGGIIQNGRSAYGKAYGYDLKDGVLSINEDQSAIVRRIFTEYTAGVGPRQIVRRLNEERLPGPRGSSWGLSALLGARNTANGILACELYIGKLLYDRRRYMKNPATGKRTGILRPRSEWKAVELPDLRIVDQATWDEVQAIRDSRGGPVGKRKQHPRHLLSGLVKCSVCGGNYVCRTRNAKGIMYLGCSTYLRTRTGCRNSRQILITTLEERVLLHLQKEFLREDRIELAMREFRAARKRQAAEKARAKGATEKELAQVRRKITNLTAAIADAGHSKVLLKQLGEMEAREEQLQAEMPKAEDGNVVELHPNAAAMFKRLVLNLPAELAKGGVENAKAREAVRGLITSIDVIPTPGRQPVELDIKGDIAVLFARAGKNGGRLRAAG